MGYPDTNLGSDAIDADFGGQPASAFGVPAFTWINSVLKFLSRAYLTYVRQPYSTIVAVSQTSAVAGDVAVHAAGTAALGGLYNVCKASGGLAAGVVLLGIYLEPCSAGAKARIAIAGIIPPNLTGLSPQSAPQVAGVNVSTGRVRVAIVGDPVVGIIDLQGQLFVTESGAQVA